MELVVVEGPEYKNYHLGLKYSSKDESISVTDISE